MKAISIVITRAEGLTRECGTKTATGDLIWAKADGILGGWAHTAPGKHGKREGYHKCDFTVTFEDGEKYEGRYDLMHFDIELPSLTRHIKQFLSYLSERENMAEQVKKWTDTYKLGD